MNRIDVGVDKDDLRYLFKILYQNGRLSEQEYNKTLEKISTYEIKANSVETRIETQLSNVLY